MRRTLVVLGFLVCLVVLSACNLPLTAAPSSAPPSQSADAEAPLIPTQGGAAPQTDGSPDTWVDPSQCNRFTAPDGSDENAGTADAPWATFAHAVASALPGDTVCFRAGTYAVPAEVSMEAGGLPEGGAITLAAYPGEQVILDGQGTASSILILKQGVSHVYVAGFTLTRFTIWGISLEGGNHHVILSHLDIGGGEAGVHFTVGESGGDPMFGPVENVIFEDSRVHDSIFTAVDCTPGPCNQMIFVRLEITGAGMQGQEASFGSDGLAVERGQFIEVTECVIHDNGGDGIDLNSRDWDGNVESILVQRNRVYRNHLQGIKLWAGGRMENNIVWGHGINPLMIGAYPGVYEVVNNTIAYNMWDASFAARDYAATFAYPGDSTNGVSAPITLTLINNLFAFNTGPNVGEPTGIYLGAGVTLAREGGNLFFSREDGEIEAEFVTGRDPWFSRQEIADGTWGQFSGSLGDLADDPLFVSGWLEADLHLMPGSPAIDAGIAEGAPAFDLDGNPRGGRPDIGAYEWNG